MNIKGITEEWLNVKAKTARQYKAIFYRSTDTLDLEGISKNNRENIQVALEKQVLVISLGAKLKVAECKEIRDWFVRNEFADFADVLTNLSMSHGLPNGFVDDILVQNKVIDYFSSFDEQIKGFKIETVPPKGNAREKSYRVCTKHNLIDSEEMAEIPLRDESSGTLKMFALYPALQAVLERGSVFWIDELNARLHPLLVRNFILTFLNPEINVNHA